MKNLKSFYLLALAAALAFAGCKKDDGGNPLPGTLTIEKTEYALDAVENRTATVAFTAAAGWALSVVYDDAESAADWLTVTPASGTAGEQTVELSATRNYRTSARTAYADLACGEQSVRLTVTQAAASDDTDFTTLFDPDFAKELQKQGIIADAENITPEDMEKIATMTELDVSGTYENPGTLTSLQGIEYFESLTQLSCYYNQLTSLDISANTALTELYCYGNQLTSLDVSANMALTWLSCSYNSLETLDISKNTALTWLDCSSNSLTTLDVSANTALTWLSCENNPGDRESKFPITAWFDNDTKPDNLEIYQGQWTYDGKTITIDYRKAESLRPAFYWATRQRRSGALRAVFRLPTRPRYHGKAK